MLPRIPSVERVLSSEGGTKLQARFGRDAVVGAVRDVIDALRQRIQREESSGQPGKPGRPAQAAQPEKEELAPDAVAGRAERFLEVASRSRIISVVNATGVVIHTNLGRATLAAAAAAEVERVACRPCALEYDVRAGRRGDRDDLVEEHILALTGAEAATIVNNNAAAVLLVLNTLAQGREAIVSRGELVEIGGSFRIPDIMEKSGGTLREVGTTNRTHPTDYENAIGPETALLLKVHTSNYRIVGFTAGVDLGGLREIADRHEGLPVVEDLGAGALVDLSRWGLPAEPVVADSLAAGADLVTFSGDKLLGGPQCGVIAGKSELIAAVNANPLKRALRCDKMTLAALEATLRIYRFDPAPEKKIPALRALVRPISELERVGEEVVPKLLHLLGDGYDVRLVRVDAQTGSGSQPDVPIDSLAVAVTSTEHGDDAAAARFRRACPPIVGRIEKDRFLLDLRTIESAAELLPSFP
ncbi:MAG: L-seryl-tRNA(Sec) selenium transferase [Myxococcales bacterium]|nr:MAG: L-seryl-tRNA(Sec) selenium transferase [Myxococcales bacterium]